MSRKNSSALSETQLLRRWKRIAIALGVSLLLAITMLLCGLFFAVKSPAHQRNLYYLMWKAGWRDYDDQVALRGMFHDREFLESLEGTSIRSFQEKFPSTFYEIQHPRWDDPNRRSFIDNYWQARSEDGDVGFSWEAVFVDGKLTEIRLNKGP